MMTTEERNERADALVRDLTSGRFALDAGNGIVYLPVYADGRAGCSGDFGNYRIQGEGFRHYDTGEMVWTWVGKRRMARILAALAPAGVSA